MYYQMSLPVTLTGHSSWLFRDKVDDIDFRFFELDAMVRSGDYLKALSSMLEVISYSLEDDIVDSTRVQSIIEQLDYIDKRYQLVEKTKKQKRS